MCAYLYMTNNRSNKRIKVSLPGGSSGSPERTLSIITKIKLYNTLYLIPNTNSTDKHARYSEIIKVFPNTTLDDIDDIYMNCYDDYKSWVKANVINSKYNLNHIIQKIYETRQNMIESEFLEPIVSVIYDVVNNLYETILNVITNFTMEDINYDIAPLLNCFNKKYIQYLWSKYGCVFYIDKEISHKINVLFFANYPECNIDGTNKPEKKVDGFNNTYMCNHSHIIKFIQMPDYNYNNENSVFGIGFDKMLPFIKFMNEIIINVTLNSLHSLYFKPIYSFGCRRNLDSKHIVDDEIYVIPGEYYVVTDYLGVSLYDKMKDNTVLFSTKLVWIYHIIESVNIMHNNNLCHNNINNFSILIGTDNIARLTEFELSKHITDETNHMFMGAMSVWDPMNLCGKNSTYPIINMEMFNIDIYQLGILFYYVIFNGVPDFEKLLVEVSNMEEIYNVFNELKNDCEKPREILLQELKELQELFSQHEKPYLIKMKIMSRQAALNSIYEPSVLKNKLIQFIQDNHLLDCENIHGDFDYMSRISNINMNFNIFLKNVDINVDSHITIQPIIKSRVSKSTQHSIFSKYPMCASLLISLLSRFKEYYSQHVDKLDEMIWKKIIRLIDTMIVSTDEITPNTCNIIDHTAFFNDLYLFFKEYKFDSLLVMSRFNEKDYVHYPRKKLKLLQDIFINESKHINEQLHEKIKNKEPILDIIYFTALKRKEIAFLQCDDLFNMFSNLRVMIDGAHSPIEGSNGRHLIPYIYHKIFKEASDEINNYKEQLKKAVEDGNTELIKTLKRSIKYTYVEPGVDEDIFHLTIQSNLESDRNRIISLTDISLIYDTAEDKVKHYLNGSWYHSSSTNIPSIFKELEYLYSQLISTIHIESKIILIGKLWWWFCQAMPFSRGSAAIAEMIFNNMIDYYTNHKYKLCDKIDSPVYLTDIHALTYDKEHFVKLFHSQFLCNDPRKSSITLHHLRRNSGKSRRGKSSSGKSRQGRSSS